MITEERKMIQGFVMGAILGLAVIVVIEEIGQKKVQLC